MSDLSQVTGPVSGTVEVPESLFPTTAPRFSRTAFKAQLVPTSWGCPQARGGVLSGSAGLGTERAWGRSVDEYLAHSRGHVWKQHRTDEPWPALQPPHCCRAGCRQPHVTSGVGGSQSKATGPRDLARVTCSRKLFRHVSHRPDAPRRPPYSCLPAFPV